jgi:tRNA acetyltransferase TAN1
MVYSYNLLVSWGWGRFFPARTEIMAIMSNMGDNLPIIRRTIAQGIAGVKTSLDSRKVISELYGLYRQDPGHFTYTSKWVPIDCWTCSDLDWMESIVASVKNKIGKDERWMMVVEKRRYTKYHKIDIIKRLADQIDGKVDLRNPEKIIRVEIIGKNAGISVIKPNEIFSMAKAFQLSMSPHTVPFGGVLGH